MVRDEGNYCSGIKFIAGYPSYNERPQIGVNENEMDDDTNKHLSLTGRIYYSRSNILIWLRLEPGTLFPKFKRDLSAMLSYLTVDNED